MATDVITAPTFLKLPINPDEGFPQAFLLSFIGTTFVLSFYANVAEGLLPDEQGYYALPQPGAFLVMSVARQTPAGPVLITRCKLVVGQIIPAGELLLRFSAMKVAPLNLNGAGAYGSVVEGEVAARWLS